MLHLIFDLGGGLHMLSLHLGTTFHAIGSWLQTLDYGKLPLDYGKLPLDYGKLPL
jgi:hypothetical protein